MLLIGQHFDASITCNDRSWEVHRAIVCPQSIFFERPLHGDFKEAESKYIDLSQDGPSDIYDMLRYLYGDPDLYNTGSFAKPSTMVQLQATAHMYEVRGLEAFNSERFDTKLRDTLKIHDMHWGDQEDRLTAASRAFIKLLVDMCDYPEEQISILTKTVHAIAKDHARLLIRVGSLEQILQEAKESTATALYRLLLEQHIKLDNSAHQRCTRSSASTKTARQKARSRATAARTTNSSRRFVLGVAVGEVDLFHVA